MPLRAAHTERFCLSSVAGIFSVLTGLPAGGFATLVEARRGCGWQLYARAVPSHVQPIAQATPMRRPHPPLSLGGSLAELWLRTGCCWCLRAEEHTQDSELVVNSVCLPPEITSMLDPCKRKILCFNLMSQNKRFFSIGVSRPSLVVGLGDQTLCP